MRGLLSVLLLVAQFQPLAGVALCQGLARTGPGLMEDGCPMPEEDSGASRGLPEQSSVALLTPATSPHDCVLADACLNAPPAVLPLELAFQPLPLPAEPSFITGSGLHGFEDLPPPIPPPNS